MRVGVCVYKTGPAGDEVDDTVKMSFSWDYYQLLILNATMLVHNIVPVSHLQPG